ncbi:PqqD family protein [Streptomyces sp. NA02950]|uniref:PqqD family protein n=1 Tax=Streptomyces sp. NA02950 TaxID=2742137 RepID=UPI0015925453|nr:PqqD family protein [Streptomyces sp. NA02950]QKV96982.1 PqqD family protein [Streptomyces sp. NA02950]
MTVNPAPGTEGPWLVSVPTAQAAREPLLRLADHAVFDPTDEAGVILDTRKDVYLALNATATLMLSAALRFGTLQEVVAHLGDLVEAPPTTLDAGVTALAHQLAQHGLLSPGEEGRP